MLPVRIKKLLECSRIHSVKWAHNDLEFLVSRWSVESHTPVSAWGEFRATLEDVLNIMALPPYGEAKAMGSTLE